MGFSVGRFAKIWKLEDKTTYTPVSDLSEADLKGKQIEVKAEFTEKVVEYLKDISFKTSYVSNARLGNLLLDTNGVFDYTEFKINDLTSNIALNDVEVPKLGTIEFTVV